MSLKYDNLSFDWTEKSLNTKVSNLSAGILNDKSAFSPVIDIIEK